MIAKRGDPDPLPALPAGESFLGWCDREPRRLRPQDLADEQVAQMLLELSEGGLAHGVQRAPAQGFDRRDRLVEVGLGRQRVGDGFDVGAAVDRDDVGAFGGQRHRMTAALTAGRAGDDRDAADELCHAADCNNTPRSQAGL